MLQKVEKVHLLCQRWWTNERTNNQMGILDTLEAIKSQKYTAEQVTKAYLEQIEKTKHKNHFRISFSSRNHFLSRFVYGSRYRF